MTLYICPKFYENIDLPFKSYTVDKILKLKISKGHYSAKKKELRFLFSTRRLMLLNICTKFHENILDGINVIEQTRFS